MRRILLGLLFAGQCALAQTYGRMDFSLQNAQGQAISGATVSVYNQSACGQPATTLATLYSTASGTTTGNPVKTDGFGHAFAYAAAACYTVIYNSPYTGTQTYPDQVVSVPGIIGSPSLPFGSYQFNDSGVFGATTHTLDAAAFVGADAGAKINACFAALTAASVKGTCDGKNLTNATAAANITIPANDTLLLPDSLVLANGVQIIRGTGSAMIGRGKNGGGGTGASTITGSVSGAGIIVSSGATNTLDAFYTLVCNASYSSTTWCVDYTNNLAAQILGVQLQANDENGILLFGAAYTAVLSTVEVNMNVGTTGVGISVAGANSVQIVNGSRVSGGSLGIDVEGAVTVYSIGTTIESTHDAAYACGITTSSSQIQISGGYLQSNSGYAMHFGSGSFGSIVNARPYMLSFPGDVILDDGVQTWWTAGNYSTFPTGISGIGNSSIGGDDFDLLVYGKGFNSGISWQSALLPVNQNQWRAGVGYSSSTNWVLQSIGAGAGVTSTPITADRSGNVYIGAGLQIAAGTLMTANHGNGTSLQHSDGTGTAGHPAVYDGNGNITDGPAGFTGSCASTTTLTVVNGIITGCV